MNREQYLSKRMQSQLQMPEAQPTVKVCDEDVGIWPAYPIESAGSQPKDEGDDAGRETGSYRK